MLTQHLPFTYAHYRYILSSALESGYKFTNFLTFKDEQRNQPICLLRHDCDNDLTAAVKIARIEAEMGVRSTYFMLLRSAQYNIMSIPNSRLVREIIQLGHWIGLHFDELYYVNSAPAQIAVYVDRERAWLSEEFSVPVEVVSFHQPSQHVLDNQIKLNCINTYDQNDMAGIYYLSDSNTVWKEGCPSNFFLARKHPHLQLLLHPEWWTVEEQTIREKWNQMLWHNFELMQQSLLERERVYTERQRIEFHYK
jgi:hypothetical protein